ncbi:hypothetical protein [Priestia megaterium]|uniref:hypothetical protein n=1 Tax=Priestia megaterium TaxID=1404 RepID=UPI001BEB2BE9|nr:hypothetical protein [Priestia megaterium]MBT2254809.1 hypothetical protein [Priestia megaterium]
MYEDKGIITKNEQILICRYPPHIQENIKERLLQTKGYMYSFSYDDWIECMEKGLEIDFYKTDKAVGVAIGKLNVSRLARLLLERHDGIPRKPLKSELEHDGRLEEFKQYPKGTRVKANGDIIY